MKSTDEILVVGDVMLDAYIIGQVERISPEAPVPVIRATQDLNMIGGAGNVAHNLSSVGGLVSLIGAIGHDPAGGKLKELLSGKDIESHLVALENYQTTVKTRIVSQTQQIVRVDHETIIQKTPEKLLEQLKEKLSRFEGSNIVISDYGKGVCSPEVCAEIMKSGQASGAKIFVDPKGTDWDKYKGAYLVKPNLREIEDLLNEKFDNQDDRVVHAGQEILNRYNLKNILITRSSKGMTLVSKEMVRHFPVDLIEIFDVSGAGDTAVAILAYMLQQGKSLVEAIQIANKASRYVVSKPSTYAITASELQLLI